jgi:hypothetical protein
MSPRRAADGGAVRLPAALVGPVDVELARAVESIPVESALPGGARDNVARTDPAQNGSVERWHCERCQPYSPMTRRGSPPRDGGWLRTAGAAQAASGPAVRLTIRRELHRLLMFSSRPNNQSPANAVIKPL